MSSRCFVIGSGPSLLDAPLDKIIGETSIACNRIAGIYPHTDWRPTHFVVVTTMANRIWWYLDIMRTISLGIDCYIWDKLELLFFPWKKYQENITYIECHETAVKTDNPEDDWWHDDIGHAVSHFGGSGTAMVQMACGLGYKEIILLGMDGNWKVGSADSDPNHFSPDYGIGSGLEKQDRVDWWNWASEISNKWIRKMTEARGVKVYNASPISGITAYPKINLEDIL